MGLLTLLMTLLLFQPLLANEGYLGPDAVVASKDGSQLLVACRDAHEVLWLALPAGRMVRRVCVPGEPTGLAMTAGGNQVVVTCAGPKSLVLVLDTQSGKTLRTVSVGHTAVSPVLSKDGSRLFVCNRFDDDVAVIDMVSGTQLARVRVCTATDCRGANTG